MDGVRNFMADTSGADRFLMRMRAMRRGAGYRGRGRFQTIDAFASTSHPALQTRPINHVTPIETGSSATLRRTLVQLQHIAVRGGSSIHKR